MDTDLHLDVAGHRVPVVVRRSGTARRMSLRLDPAGAVVVVVPSLAPLSEAERFARSQREWIAQRLNALPHGVALEDGVEIPILGVPHIIRHDPAARRGVWAEAGVLHVSGLVEHLPRRVETFLKSEARMVLAARARDLAERIGRKPGRISVRDTRARWGSCAANGNLSFCWRLILAPSWVLEYVVAHEVAHLAEMNHGPDFWRLVGRLVEDMGTARDWLKRHGPGLHRYGVPPL